MKELALHILDLVENSITAGASIISLQIDEDTTADKLTIAIADDGCGMSEEILKTVTDPFYTTRTTRDVGLGIPMFKMNAELCGGHFSIDSVLGQGTELSGQFQYSHIDRPPLGNMSTTIVGIVMSLEAGCDLHYTHRYNQREFELNTIEMREMLGAEISLSDVSVLQWVKDYVAQGLAALEESS